MKTGIAMMICGSIVAAPAYGFCPMPLGVTRSMAPLFAKPSTEHEVPKNEFHRPLSTDRILKTGGGKKRLNKEYSLSIEAKEEERQALARRFGLPNIQSLVADLSIRRPPEEMAEGSSYYYSNGLVAVQVEGKLEARVTQKCVRTNEDFEVDVTFPVLNLVRPTTASQMAEDDEQMMRELKRNNIKTPSTTADILDLQSLLQDVVSEDDAIVEDEAIYSSVDGNLDVGELVAQVLWLNLDPYPKKPGTSPVSFSISG